MSLNSSSSEYQYHTPAQLRAAAALELRRRLRATGVRDLYAYQDDPAGFVWDVLGEDMPLGIVRIMESVRDNPITLVRSANAVGKTWGAARLAVWFYLVWEDSQVYTTSAPPEENLRHLLWGELSRVQSAHTELFRGHLFRSLLIAREPHANRAQPTSFIAGVRIPTTGSSYEREAKFAGKHPPHLFYIVDEGDAVPDEVYRGIFSCMSGAHARLLVLFNPRSRRGRVWRMERDRQANVLHLSAFEHPNVRSGRQTIPGAVSRETVARRVNEWTRPLVKGEAPNSECFELPEFLVGAVARSLDGRRHYAPLAPGWRRIVESAFYYMVLGLYPATGSRQLMRRDDVDNARARYDMYAAQHGATSPDGISPVMGLDVAEFGEDSCAACFRYGGYVAPFIVWN